MRSNYSIHSLTSCQIEAFSTYLRAEEREASTIEKYVRNVRTFAAYLNDASVNKEYLIKWK